MTNEASPSKSIRERIQFWLYIAGLIGGLLTTTIAWGNRELNVRFDRKLDVVTYRQGQIADSAWKSEMHAIVLDALCSKNVDPTNQRCHR